MSDEENNNNSTTAENLKEWKELLSSLEAKEFVNSILERLAIMFGKTSGAVTLNIIGNLLLMITAFGCVGLLAYFKLVPDGTTGVLAGIIIGYFFKKNY